MTDAAASARFGAIGAKAADLAHNLSNLLATIVAAADAALARPSVDPDTRSDLTRIKSGAADGAAMLRRLLAGDDSPRTNLRLARIDPIIEDFAATLRQVIGSRLRLTLELGLPGGAALLDAEELRHALLNLTVNARDAMPDGGALGIATSVATIRQPLAAIPQPIPPGRYAVVALRDSGAGIVPELIERVFAPFYTTKPARCGSGLGLHSVREAARQCGGFVSIASTPDVGTEVRLYLPLLDTSSRCGAGRYVLLVEDEPAQRRFMARLLDREGWRVTAFADARSALRALSHRRGASTAPDILISDIGLPDMEGLALARAARHIQPGLPAILVSGYADDRALAEQGEIALLRKPFEAGELLDLVTGLTASNPRFRGVAESA